MMNRNYFSDISSNNSSFNAAQYASAGYGAIAIKATEDSNYTNPKYAEWVRDAHAHGLPVFHYAFTRPENGNPTGQVDHFWNTVRPHFRRPGDYIVFDVETGSPAEAAKWLKEADNHLHNISGTHPRCYCPLSYYQEGHLEVSSKEFWVAAWGSKRPGNRWALGRGNILWAWQYDDGSGLSSGVGPHGFAGIPGTTDSSILNPSLSGYLHKLRQHHRRQQYK